MKIAIRKISKDEYLAWKKSSVENYAKEKMNGEGYSEEDAKELAENSFKRLLPEEENTQNQYLYSIIEIKTKAVVGTLWWGFQNLGKEKLPWVYDIVLNPEFRSKGYGKMTMLLLEEDVKKAGFQKIGLHVFGHNQVARSLYESLGYHVTNLTMQKSL
ncbi:MAG: GNAT family N-acetyltransferase [Oligoflexia bacterium]|nr:GNAT family N-acetyltransferase [Oligoflexia bacterium]